MKAVKKVIETIYEKIFRIEYSFSDGSRYEVLMDRELLDDDVKENDLVEFYDGKFHTLKEETKKETERIQEKLDKLFNN
ncbi:MAG: DUF3006 domain-containing protein [Clostridia bacterium]|nr:DUF3006 domain-containing protein [Clostridia bacterium]